MELPMEIPRELAEIAVPVEVAGPGESYPAWSREDALAVVECLRGTKVAIEGGEVFRTDRLGLRTAIEIWDCERIAAETATDYAERSRDMAQGRAHFPEHYTIIAPDLRGYGFRQAAGPRGSRQLFETRDGAGHDGGDGEPQL